GQVPGSGSALVFAYRSEERANVLQPEPRLLKGWEVSAMRHRREVDDVISGFGRLARFGAARIKRVVAPIVLQRKRTASGRRVHPGIRPREGCRRQGAKHVPAFVIDPCGRGAAV